MKLRNNKSTCEEPIPTPSKTSTSTSSRNPNVHIQNSKVPIVSGAPSSRPTSNIARKREKRDKCVDDAKSKGEPRSTRQSTKSAPANEEAGVRKGLRETLTSKQDKKSMEATEETTSERMIKGDCDNARRLSECFLSRMRLFCQRCGEPRVCHVIDSRSRLVCHATPSEIPKCELCGQQMFDHARGGCPAIDAEVRLWILVEEWARECQRCDRALLFHECVGRERKVICPRYDCVGHHGRGGVKVEEEDSSIIKQEEDEEDEEVFTSNTVKEVVVKPAPRRSRPPVCTRCHTRMKGHKRNGAGGKWICRSE